MAQKAPKRQEGPTFFTGDQSSNETKKWALLNWILFSSWEDTACDRHANKKLKNIKNNSKIYYLHFIPTKLYAKGGQIQGLDFSLQIHRKKKETE